jgi:hypothetical protein
MSKKKMNRFLIEYTLTDFSNYPEGEKNYPRVEGMVGESEDSAKAKLISMYEGMEDKVKIIDVQPFYKQKQNQQL